MTPFCRLLDASLPLALLVLFSVPHVGDWPETALLAGPASSPAAPSDHATVFEPTETLADRFGPRLAPLGPAVLTEGAMDVVSSGGWIYVLSRGRLCTFRGQSPLASAPVGELQGLGNTRQIELAGNLAGITSREDGFWLVDVTHPAKPVLLSHYDTIELATGVAMSDNVALVACRQYGLEQIDISNPRRPLHLSTFRTGEAQSVFLQNGLAYIGDWGPHEVVVCDVHNPCRPAPVSRIELDGYGDGVFVRGNVCFAATGHHSRAIRTRSSDDPAYGMGHGLEIYDVTDPKHPRLLSRTRLPRLYCRGYDMWNVQVSGDFAVVGDTHNGVYVFDIRDLTHPVPVGYHRLPVAGGQGLPDAVGGFAIGRDCIYVAGAATGLHTVSIPGIQPVPVRSLERIALPKSCPPIAIAPPAVAVYQPEGQVHEVAVDRTTDEVWIAAGTAGLHRMRAADPGSGRQVAPTKGVMLSVDLLGDLLATGEGTAGMSLWRRRPQGVEAIGRYQSDAGGIGQVRISPDKHYAIVHAGTNVLEIVDIRSPDKPTRVFDDRRPGLFYRTPFSDGFLPDGRFACLWHASGAFFYDLGGKEGPRFSGWSLPSASIGGTISNGAAVCGQRFLVVCDGGYALLEPGQTSISKDGDVKRAPGISLRGKPSIVGTTLYAAQRWQGEVAAIDIADIEHPRLRWSFEIQGNPGTVREIGGRAIIPGGYDGVIVRPR